MLKWSDAEMQPASYRCTYTHKPFNLKSVCVNAREMQKYTERSPCASNFFFFFAEN